MHPLDALIDNHPSTSATPTPNLPGGQALVAGSGAGGEAATMPPTSVPFPPLRDGFVLAEIPWPTPCPRCGSYAAWWDMHGRQRCQACGGQSGSGQCLDDAKQFERGLRGARLAIRLRVRSFGKETPGAFARKAVPAGVVGDEVPVEVADTTEAAP